VRAHHPPLAVVERPGLVQGLVRDRDLADVVLQRAELDIAPLPVIQAELVGDRERELDDVARVLARVGVVRVDDLGQDKSGAAVGAGELGQLHEARAPLAREHRQDAEQRDQQRQVPRGLVDREGSQKADRRERHIDHHDSAALRGVGGHRALDDVYVDPFLRR
jgi:hypothetical protein